MGLCGNETIVGPFFFERNVNGVIYLEMLNEQVFPELLHSFNDPFVNGSFQRLWWAQDGAPSHRTVDVREFLTEFFEGRITALNHSSQCPPPPPTSDLTP